MNVTLKLLDRVDKSIAFLLVAFFAYTFINKLLMFQAFKLNIAGTGVFYDVTVDLVAITALIAEATSVLLLIFKRKWGKLFSLAMMSLFTVYILYLARTGRYEVCGCGGILNGLSFSKHLTVNLLLILILLLSLFYDHYKHNKILQ